MGAKPGTEYPGGIGPQGWAQPDGTWGIPRRLMTSTGDSGWIGWLLRYHRRSNNCQRFLKGGVPLSESYPNVR